MGRALLVGIDDYPTSPLGGCVADANALSDLLARNHDQEINYDVRCMTSDEADITRSVLRGALADLFDNAKNAELLFFYAGHGAQSSWGGELVTPDHEPASLGVSMNDVIMLANQSPAREVTLILDCCFSGDMANVPGMQAAGVSEQFRKGLAVLGENVTLLAASRPTEPAAESAGHGAFTRLLLDGLEGAAADLTGEVTALSLYSYASRAFGDWGQRPVFKSHVTRPSVLRHAAPWIDKQVLRDLPAHFAAADAKVQLSPAHEGVNRPLKDGQVGTTEQQQFDYFKVLQQAGLLTGDDPALYWIAMRSDYVWLTSKGRHYWALAQKGVI